MRVEYLRVHLEEAGPAENGAALRWVERDGRRLITTGTSDGDLDALLYAGCLGGGNGGEAFILRLFTLLTAFWWILETLIAEELLFAGRPDEVAPAVDTMDGSVLRLRPGHRGNPYFRARTIETVL